MIPYRQGRWAAGTVATSVAILITLVVSPTVASAAAHDTAPTLHNVASDSIQQTAVTAQNPPAADRDAWKVIRTRSLAGFGGSYLDSEDGVLHVWATEPDRLNMQQAVDVLSDEASSGPVSLSDIEVDVHQAEYTFADLKGWHDRLRQILDFEGLTWTDIDERSNRIKVGLENPSLTGRKFLASSRALGVPDEAVMVVKGDRYEPDLRQVRRPLVGGLQIMYDLLQRFVCSVGFPAQISGETGFFTASHCSAQPYGGSVGDAYWQPLGDATNPGQNLVASKHFDPPAFPCSGLAGCRFSDALFARVEGVGVDRGFIARAPFGSPNWNGTSEFRITDVEPSAPQPGEVRKVGRTTGQSFGEVIDLCLNFQVSITPVLNYGLLCQDTASYGSAGGDSGAPVFRITSGNDVQLVGIHWGSAGTAAVFSAMVNVEFEFGSMIVCAPGFTC